MAAVDMAVNSPLTLGLDVGTSSIRAIIYDAAATPIESSTSHTSYRMTATPDGGVEIDADYLLELIYQTIDGALLSQGRKEPIEAVGRCTFWHAMLGVDARGRAITPLFSWNDTRSASDARSLQQNIGVWSHKETGTVLHSSYYPAKIAWLRRTRPALASKVTKWVSIGEYLYFKLFGEFSCSVSMASGTGLFNPNANRWSEAMLDGVGLETASLSRIADEGEAFTNPQTDFTSRWPALKRAKWLPTCGDGAASNIGSGCFTHKKMALNIGTSGAVRVCFSSANVTIPDGLWCYRANHELALLGGALSNAGDILTWCADVFTSPAARLTDALGRKGPGHGLAALPFLSGERSTGWHDGARGVIGGLSLSTGSEDIVQVAIESVCYRFAAVYDLLRPHCRGVAQVIASGGAAQSPTVWPGLLADVLGVPIEVSRISEASNRGAAMLAMEATGIVGRLSEVETLPGALFLPDKERHEGFKLGRAMHEALYDKVLASPTLATS